MAKTLFGYTAVNLPWTQNFYDPVIKYTYQSTMTDFAAAINDMTEWFSRVQNGRKMTNTSASNLLITNAASRVFAVDTADHAMTIGTPVFAASRANPANRMAGRITAIDLVGNTITVLMASSNGAGTFADWSIGLDPGGGTITTDTLGVGVNIADGQFLQRQGNALAGVTLPDATNQANYAVSQLMGGM